MRIVEFPYLCTMEISFSTKSELYTECKTILKVRMENAKKQIDSAQAAATTETKSSAGDKFETAREMLQQEKRKAQQQLAEVLKHDEVLNQINPAVKLETVQLGSLVETSIGNFFISVGIGKLRNANQVCYAISLASPLGKAISGLSAGESTLFRGKPIRVNSIY